LYVVVRQGAVVLQLMASKDQADLIRLLEQSKICEQGTQIIEARRKKREKNNRALRWQ
jgi:hypothetical protein